MIGTQTGDHTAAEPYMTCYTLQVWRPRLAASSQRAAILNPGMQHARRAALELQLAGAPAYCSPVVTRIRRARRPVMFSGLSARQLPAQVATQVPPVIAVPHSQWLRCVSVQAAA